MVDHADLCATGTTPSSRRRVPTVPADERTSVPVPDDISHNSIATRKRGIPSPSQEDGASPTTQGGSMTGTGHSTKQQCTIPGCRRQRRARGWCDMHYVRWRKYGSPDIVHHPGYAPREPRVCQVPGCDHPVIAHQRCVRHDRQMRRHGRLTPEREHRTRPRPCTAPGCTRPVSAREMCVKHYLQVAVHGRLTPELERHPAQPCVAPDCPHRAIANGYCNQHYLQCRRHGRLTPELESMPRHGPCHRDGCHAPIRARGLCSTHYQQQLLAHGSQRSHLRQEKGALA